MNDDDRLLINRFKELAERAFSRSVYTNTEFLTLAEQDLLLKTHFDKNCAPFQLYGGYKTPERAIASFGSEDICGYANEIPIICICMEPVSLKFSDDLSHRDFLGALMSVGVRRSVIGDIIVSENRGYVFCLESAATLIIDSLDSIKHTSVKSHIVESMPENAVNHYKQKYIIIASERLDSVISAVYGMSRSESKHLIERELVFVNSRIKENVNYSLSENDIISVRGFGRFIYNGAQRETRKGKLRAEVSIYGKD